MKTMSQQIDTAARRRKIRRTAITLALVAFAIYIAFYLDRIFF